MTSQVDVPRSTSWFETIQPDNIRQMASLLSFEDIFNICRADQRLEVSIWQSIDFWKNKLRQDYPAEYRFVSDKINKQSDFRYLYQFLYSEDLWNAAQDQYLLNLGEDTYLWRRSEILTDEILWYRRDPSFAKAEKAAELKKIKDLLSKLRIERYLRFGQTLRKPDMLFNEVVTQISDLNLLFQYQECIVTPKVLSDILSDLRSSGDVRSALTHSEILKKYNLSIHLARWKLVGIRTVEAKKPDILLYFYRDYPGHDGRLLSEFAESTLEKEVKWPGCIQYTHGGADPKDIYQISF